ITDHKGFNPNLGELFWDVLTDNKVVYINTDEDYYDNEDGNFYYVIHIVDLNSLKDTKIKRKFNPVKLPEDLNRFIIKTITTAKADNEMKDIYRKKGFFTSSRLFHLDKDILYVYLYEGYYRNKFDNSKEKIFPTDIFDLNQQKYIKSVIFPEYIFPRNGKYHYDIGTDKEGFPVIKKYRIDPAVYGK
ncbi:hypothetical protein ACFL5P_01485, partial [candidate division KSB1 bacterium]